MRQLDKRGRSGVIFIKSWFKRTLVMMIYSILWITISLMGQIPNICVPTSCGVMACSSDSPGFPVGHAERSRRSHARQSSDKRAWWHDKHLHGDVRYGRYWAALVKLNDTCVIWEAFLDLVWTSGRHHEIASSRTQRGWVVSVSRVRVERR